jgi:hypothetical protein
LGYRREFPPPPLVTQITRLTNSGRFDPWGGIASDGSRLFFLERDGDHWNNRQISAAGGESAPFDSPFKNTRTFAVSPDQSELLLVPFISRDSDRPLWSMPLVGGAPRRIGDIVVEGAAYSPDGKKIAVTNTTGVYVANRDGSELRRLSTLHGLVSHVVPPPGRRKWNMRSGPPLLTPRSPHGCAVVGGAVRS